MKESLSGFQKLISALPKTFTVLDAGAGGLHGENTTDFLAAHFDPKNILGVCWSDHEVSVYHAQRAEKRLPPVSIVSADFYKLEFNPPMQFDLAVLDMNIESNLGIDWTDEGMERMQSFVKDGGYLILYLMTTDQYGDPDKTPAFIREQWKKHWQSDRLSANDIDRKLKSLKGWELFAQEREQRRDYITWVMLKKTSGS